MHRIAQSIGHQGQTAGGCHFKDGRPAVFRDAIRYFDLIHQRIMRFTGDPLHIQIGTDRFRGSFTAIGYRETDCFTTGEFFPYGPKGTPGNVEGLDRTFK